MWVYIYYINISTVIGVEECLQAKSYVSEVISYPTLHDHVLNEQPQWPSSWFVPFCTPQLPQHATIFRQVYRKSPETWGLFGENP